MITEDLHEVNLDRATLVAFYDNKPEKLAELIGKVQGALAAVYGDLFTARPIKDTHVTILGLDDSRQLASNSDLGGLIQFLQHALASNPLKLQFGGFDEGEVMLSRGEALSKRSFTVARHHSVLIGWPVRSASMQYAQAQATVQLAELRRSCEAYGFTHKYSRNGSDDPDAYMVVGDFCGPINAHDRRRTVLRELIQTILSEPTWVDLDDESLSLVEYVETTLPHSTSISRPISSLV